MFLNESATAHACHRVQGHRSAITRRGPPRARDRRVAARGRQHARLPGTTPDSHGVARRDHVRDDAPAGRRVAVMLPAARRLRALRSGRRAARLRWALVAAVIAVSGVAAATDPSRWPQRVARLPQAPTTTEQGFPSWSSPPGTACLPLPARRRTWSRASRRRTPRRCILRRRNDGSTRWATSQSTMRLAVRHGACRRDPVPGRKRDAASNPHPAGGRASRDRHPARRKPINPATFSCRQSRDRSWRVRSGLASRRRRRDGASGTIRAAIGASSPLCREIAPAKDRR